MAKYHWKLRGGGKFSGRFPIKRLTESDADGDGIPDRDDALLFTPNEPVVWQIEKPELTPETDGLPGEGLQSTGRRFDFAGKDVPKAEGFERDSGQPFDEVAGFGWKDDLSKNHRRRNVYPEISRDTFLFTRAEDTWECRVANGRYRVTVCVGDADHDQLGQHVWVEGQPMLADVSTTAGRFAEHAAEVAVADGYLTVTIGQSEGKKVNTCVNWLAFEKIDK